MRITNYFISKRMARIKLWTFYDLALPKVVVVLEIMHQMELLSDI